LGSVVIATGCCVGSWDRFEANVVPGVLGPVLALYGESSIGAAYNTILDWAADRGVDLLVLQHDDLQITDPDLEPKLAAAMGENVALIGVAGARGVQGIAWWNFDTIGHQHTDAGLIDFGPRTGDVDALEGSFLAFTRWAIDHLRFDEVPGFHGYDVGIARKAVDAGMRVTVADIDTHHHTVIGFKSADSHQQWLDADQRFRQRGQP
jgi:glycosyltransferase involved in cell wall biosynthesis